MADFSPAFSPDEAPRMPTSLPVTATPIEPANTSSAPPYDVLVHGLIGIDYLLGLDSIPTPGEVSAIENEARLAGGEAVNCALMLAKWGARVALCGNPYGSDSNGRALLKAMTEVPGLTLLASHVPEMETPYSVVLSAWNGPRTVLTRHEGAMEWERAWEAKAVMPDLWPGARLATCDGHWLSPTYQLAQMLKERSVPLIAQDALLNESVAALAEIVLLTDAFWPGENEKHLLREARARADEWGNTVIITRGKAGGVWCAAGNMPQHFEPVHCGEDNLAGSVGAGDVFRAGLLWSRLCGYDWGQTLRFAAAAAAIKCTRPAGYEALPTRDEVEALVG
jgi:sulfofructose kinase